MNWKFASYFKRDGVSPGGEGRKKSGAEKWPVNLSKAWLPRRRKNEIRGKEKGRLFYFPCPSKVGQRGGGAFPKERKEGLSRPSLPLYSRQQLRLISGSIQKWWGRESFMETNALVFFSALRWNVGFDRLLIPSLFAAYS